MTANFSITLQATRNLDYILATFRLGDLVFRALSFVPLHEEWEGSKVGSN